MIGPSRHAFVLSHIFFIIKVFDRYGQEIQKNASLLWLSINHLSVVLPSLKTRSCLAVTTKLSRFGVSVIDSVSS
jgi:hypothetical protein